MQMTRKKERQNLSSGRKIFEINQGYGCHTRRDVKPTVASALDLHNAKAASQRRADAGLDRFDHSPGDWVLPGVVPQSQACRPVTH